MREVARQFCEQFGDNKGKSRKRARLFLMAITDRAGLLVEREPDSYAFAHLSFQEYMAARAVADRADYVGYTVMRLHYSWWVHVVMLEVGHLSSLNTRRSRQLTTDLIRGIRNANSWLEDVLKRDLVWAGYALGEVGPLGVSEELRHTTIDELFDLWSSTQYEKLRLTVTSVFANLMQGGDGENFVHMLISLISNPDAELRRKAVRSLGWLALITCNNDILRSTLYSLKCREPELFDLKSSPHDQSKSVDFSARQLGWEAEIASLHTNTKVKGQSRRHKSALDSLVWSFREAEPSMRRVLYSDLLLMADNNLANRRLLNKMLTLLQDEDMDVRRMTAAVLIKIGYGGLIKTRKTIFERSYGKAVTEKRRMIRGLRNRYSQLPAEENVPVLLRFLQDQVRVVRWAAARALASAELFMENDDAFALFEQFCLSELENHDYVDPVYVKGLASELAYEGLEWLSLIRPLGLRSYEK